VKAAPAKTAAKPAPKKEAQKPAAQPKKDAVADLFDFGSSPTTSSNKQNGKSTQAKPASTGIEDLFGSMSVSNGSYSGQTLSGSGNLSNAPKHTLLKSVVGGGLSIEYSYLRSPSMHGATVNTLQLWFKNVLQKPINDIALGKQITEGIQLIPFGDISSIQAGETVESQMSVQFTSVTTPIKFEINTQNGNYPVTLNPSVGELVRASTLSPTEFSEQEKKLKGMNETSETFDLKSNDDITRIVQRVLAGAYLATVNVDFDAGKFKFSGRTMVNTGSNDVLLLSMEVVDKEIGKLKVSVSSENTIMNPMLLKHLKKTLLGDE